MNTQLYSVDPILQKISRAFEAFTRTVIELYIGMFAAVGSGFLIIFGAIMVLVGLMLQLHQQSAVSSSVFLVPLGLAWIFSSTARRLTWTFLGFCVIWTIVLTATLLPFLGEGKQSFSVQIVLAFAYLLPPFIATGMTVKYKSKCQSDHRD